MEIYKPWKLQRDICIKKPCPPLELFFIL